MTIRLKGMTWSHPRGYDPMVACSAAWQQQTGVAIDWDKRSLQDFESFPVAELAAAYDLIVIDHPHVGQITHEGCLLPLDTAEHSDDLAALSAGTVGRSYPSYHWQGRQWAFPIDAATQVQAFRPDRFDGPVSDLEEVVRLTKAGRVLLPMRPPHSLMVFYTLAAHLGHDCTVEGPALIDKAAGTEVIDWMQRLTDGLDPACYGLDPIAVLDRMGEVDCAQDLSPLIYGYVSYSVAGFRPKPVAFADIAVIGGRPPNGSALGGTGIAVSSRTQAPDAARAFARWLASGPVQRSLYAEADGQPGHADAWEDAQVNARTLNFYRNTRATLEGAFVRPRHDGYMGFQEQAAQLLTAAFRDRTAGPSLVEDINDLFARSFAGAI